MSELCNPRDAPHKSNPKLAWSPKSLKGLMAQEVPYLDTVHRNASPNQNQNIVGFKYPYAGKLQIGNSTFANNSILLPFVERPSEKTKKTTSAFTAKVSDAKPILCSLISYHKTKHAKYCLPSFKRSLNIFKLSRLTSILQQQIGHALRTYSRLLKAFGEHQRKRTNCLVFCEIVSGESRQTQLHLVEAMEDWTSFESVPTHFNIKHLEPKCHMQGSHPKSPRVKMLTLDNSGQHTSDDFGWLEPGLSDRPRSKDLCGSVDILQLCLRLDVYHWGLCCNWPWPLKWRRSLAGSPSRSVWISWNLNMMCWTWDLDLTSNNSVCLTTEH